MNTRIPTKHCSSSSLPAHTRKNASLACASMVLFRFCAALIAVTVSGVLCNAFAGVLAVSSYDMPNGAGQASGAGPAGFNYWDGTYNGTGNVHQDSAPLSGGVGALTDGIISTQPFFNVE